MTVDSVSVLDNRGYITNFVDKYYINDLYIYLGDELSLHPSTQHFFRNEEYISYFETIYNYCIQLHLRLRFAIQQKRQLSKHKSHTLVTLK